MLLSKHERTLLRIIEHLYTNENTTLEAICLDCKVTLKTLRKDIKFLNVFLKPIIIKIKESDGVSCCFPTNYSISYVYELILKSNKEFVLLYRIFKEEIYSVENISDEMFLSITTVYRTINRMNQRFKKERFKISLSPLEITGNEMAIRYYIELLLIESNTKATSLFNVMQMRTLDLVFESYKCNGIRHQWTSINGFYLSFFVNITRFKNKHYTKIEQRNNVEQVALYLDENIYDLFKINFDLNKEQVNSIMLQVKETYQEVSFEKVSQLMLADQKLNRKGLLIQELITQVNHVFGNDDAQKEQEVTQQIANYQFRGGSSHCLINDRYSLFIRIFSRTNAIFIEELKNELMKFEKKLHLSESEKLFFLYCFSVNYYGYPKKYNEKRFLMNIVLIFNSTTISREEIMGEFSIDIKFHVITNLLELYESENFKKYDLVITDIIGIHTAEIPVVNYTLINRLERKKIFNYFEQKLIAGKKQGK